LFLFCKFKCKKKREAVPTAIMDKNKSKTFYRIFKENSLDKEDWDELFNYCRKIAKNYLFKRSTSYKFLNSGPETLDDLAMESISSLFLNDSNDGNPGLLRSFENLRKDITSESQFNFILYKIIWHRAEQHITRILKDQDPVFARILKSLNYLLKKHNYRKENYFGKVFIVKYDTERIDYKVIDEDAFEGIPVELIFVRTGDDFEKLFSAIEKDFGYFPAIPLIALAGRIKQSLSNEYNSLIGYSTYNSGYNELRIDELINLGLNKSIAHLNSSYVDHKKLSRRESDLFIKGLKDVAEDAKNGGISRGLYEYLSKYKTDLTKEEFQTKYYQQFEYLVRIFKNSIADEILDERHN
jgi:arsenate reductase-like glutaredoxin family protein